MLQNQMRYLLRIRLQRAALVPHELGIVPVQRKRVTHQFSSSKVPYGSYKARTPCPVTSEDDERIWRVRLL